MHPAKFAIAIAALSATPAAAQQVRALYTGDAGLATSNVPGMPGSVFNDAVSGLTTFDRPYVSPDGNTFGFVADLEASGTFFDDVLVVFPINNPSAGVSLAEAATFGDVDGRLTYQLDQRVSLTNDGRAAFTSSTRNANTTNAGDGLFVFDSATGTLVERLNEGDSFAGGTIGGSVGPNSPYLAFNGTVGANTALENGGAQEIDVVAFGSTVYETDGTTPSGAPAPTAIFEFESTYFGNQGQSYLTQARTFPPNRTVDTTIVNGNVVINGGGVLPNSGFNSVVVDTGPAFAGMNESGTWYARGSNVDGTEWTVIDGFLAAVEGDELFDGSTETWLEFDGITVDADGNFVIVGVSSSGDGVMVYNGDTVLARTGDDIDLGGYTIRDFSVDDLVLGNNGDVVFAARLLNGGANAGQALLTVAVPEPTSLALLGLGGLTLLRRRR